MRAANEPTTVVLSSLHQQSHLSVSISPIRQVCLTMNVGDCWHCSSSSGNLRHTQKQSAAAVQNTTHCDNSEQQPLRHKATMIVVVRLALCHWLQDALTEKSAFLTWPSVGGCRSTAAQHKQPQAATCIRGGYNVYNTSAKSVSDTTTNHSATRTRLESIMHSKHASHTHVTQAGSVGQVNRVGVEQR